MGCLTKGAKSIVHGQAASHLEIVAMYGRSDSPATFRADSAEWREHVRAILRYENLLSLASARWEEPSERSAAHSGAPRLRADSHALGRVPVGLPSRPLALFMGQ